MGSGSGYVDGNADLASRSREQLPYVLVRAEPQLLPVGEARGEALRNEQPCAAIAGCYRGGFVEQRARVEDLQHLGMRPTQRCPVRLG